jgi:PAS domain S-box-containing protein
VTGWPYAEAWKPTESGVLRRADAEYVETAFEAFAAFSEGVTFEPGEGLPGRVWASEEPEWMADLSDGSPERYPRLERALEAGFRSSFGVPILSDGEVVAVITFLVPESREDDERLVDTVSSVAAELGVLVTRRRLEERIARERDLVDRMLETSPVGIAVLDAGGEYTRINDRAREVVGTGHRTPADLAFRDPDGERVAPHEHPDSRVLATGEPVYDWEARVESTDGSERWLSVNAVPVLDADGEVERVVMALEDVTRLKRQARRLERQHEALRGEVSEVFDRLSDGLFGLDSALRFTFANDRAAELLDRKPATLVGSDVRDVIGLTERLEEAFHEARSTQESVSVEEFYPALEAWFETRIYPSDTGLSVYFRDVTERKQQERALEESRRRYRTLVENFPNGAVSLVDREVRYVVFGGTPLDANAPSPAELEGSKVAEVLSPPAAETLVSRYEAALEGEAATFEMTVDDRSHLVRTLPVRDDEGEVFAAMGMSQDITERKRLERERENRLRQQAVVADLGQRALERSDIDGLLADAVELVAETLDNEYAKVLELDADADGLLLREGVGWDEGLVGSATVSAVEDDSQAAHTLAVAEPVVVTDLGAESRFSGPDLLRAHDVRSGISVIIGPPDDPWGILGTHDTSRKRPSEHDANFVQSVANVLSTAIDRMHYEWELERQHMQLAVLNNLAGAIRDISGAVIEQSTRTEIEETVCERLADSSSYLFAWVADVDPDTQEVNVRAEAGTDGYLEGMTISVDPDDEHGRGPTGRAFRTGEVAVAEDVRSDSQHDPWREAVETHDVRSSAAIPVAHEGVVYGVLNVYSNRVNAFTGEERTAIASLGEVVGHAIAATERKRALTSDELIELEFRATDVFAAVDAPVDPAGTITFEHAVPLEEGMFLVYGTATPDAADVLRGLAAELPTWETITFRSEEGDEDGDAEGDGNGNATEFELRLVDPPVLSAVASVGGDVDRIVIEGDDLRMQVHLAPSADVRRVIDIVEDTYPNAELLRRQQVTRSSDGVQSVRRRLVEDLTDKQRTALDVAYRSGFFEWPREVTGEDVAESLDVSAPTFHQHLRKAERKVLGTLFATDVAVAE